VFIPFLVYDLEIRREICSTNAIESLNTGVPSAPVGVSRANRPR
jgi:transposase-like protein